MSFPNIQLVGAGKGSFKLLDDGFEWHSTSTGRTEKLPLRKIESLYWLAFPRYFQLEVTVKDNDESYRFNGFEESHFSRLSVFVSENSGLEIKKKEISARGWNWGDISLKEKGIQFSSGNDEAFQIPFSSISQSVFQNKTEVSVEFHQDDSAEKDAANLVELRFFIPNHLECKSIHNDIVNNAEISATGESIVILSEMPCITPRGRYEMELFPLFMNLHGKTYSFKIFYKSVVRLFILPRPDERHVHVVVSLDPPIRQGQTSYNHLVLMFPKDDELDVDLTLSEEKIKENYPALTKHLSGPAYEIVGDLLAAVSKKKITAPSDFVSHQGTNAIKCSLKANDGYLFPLKKSFFFLNKANEIRFEMINDVEFLRVSRAEASVSRTFDFQINLKNKTDFTFTQVSREEYKPLVAFLKEKKLRIHNLADADDQLDEGEREEENDHDIYKAKVQAEAEFEDEEEESEDEDYNTGSESDDIAEEYDSAAEALSGGESEDDAGEDKRSKRKRDDGEAKSSKKRKN
eukprot:GCRY01003113.1.p1 GENE.GCRY01003113.1~~GCRY01003113.1.p1  ORF type:complete len:518 (+),score=117.36 GCRY01003113.1:130-1683(+)